MTEQTNQTLTLDLKEAAALIGQGATANFVRLLINRGELKFVRIGKKYCVTRGAIERWLATNESLKD